MFVACGGKIGANESTIVVPSGRTNARYSPPAASLKFVCSSPAGGEAALSEAKTSNVAAEPIVVPAGNAHLLRFALASVRKNPLRSMGADVVLNSSIQSDESPSPSRRPPLLEAKNSEMTTSAAIRRRSSSRSNPRTHLLREEATPLVLLPRSATISRFIIRRLVFDADATTLLFRRSCRAYPVIPRRLASPG